MTTTKIAPSTEALAAIAAAPVGINTDCRACVGLAGMTQCNVCRVERPNRQTMVRQELWRLVSEGMSPVEAEAAMNVTPCVIN